MNTYSQHNINVIIDHLS